MTDTATLARPFALGDAITYTENGHEYSGTVAGIYSTSTPGVDGTGDPYPSLWVAGDYPYPHPFSTAQNNYSATGRAQWDETTPATTQGHWVSTRYDAPRLAVEEDSSALSESAAQITALEATVSDLRADVAAAHDVVRIIAEHMKEEAVDRGWCETFESVVDKINRALPARGGFDDTFTEAARRERDFTVRFYGTYTVTAFDSDSAREAFDSLDFGDLHGDVEVDYVEDAS